MESDSGPSLLQQRHFSGCDNTSSSGPAPLRSQHKREIAARLGYSDAEIETLQQGCVLYPGESI